MAETLNLESISKKAIALLGITAIAICYLVSQPGELNREQQKAVESLGGQDFDFPDCDDPEFRDTQYCNKGSHAERSKVAQPNHLDWWKKQP